MRPPALAVFAAALVLALWCARVFAGPDVPGADVRPDTAELVALRDSVRTLTARADNAALVAAARVDTVRQVVTRWREVTAPARHSVYAMADSASSPVPLAEVLAAGDSVVEACERAVSSCERAVAAKDSVIGAQRAEIQLLEQYRHELVVQVENRRGLPLRYLPLAMIAGAVAWEFAR